MSAKEAVDFIKKDHGDVGDGFRGDFAADKPYRSILQRNGKTLEDVLGLFDWKEDDARWTDEYTGARNITRMIRYRRRIAYCIGGWREFNEDFGRGDVSCIREMRTPLVTSRSPLMAAKDEFDE